MLATGFEARRERMDIVSDPRCDAAEFIGVCSSTVHGTRDSWSAYGELSIPLRADLEGQLAARYDHYSQFGGAATPKVGFKWTATDSIAVRGTWDSVFGLLRSSRRRRRTSRLLPTSLSIRCGVRMGDAGPRRGFD
jgi:outer membrane receptor for ferrienterochelin and colicin